MPTEIERYRLVMQKVLEFLAKDKTASKEKANNLKVKLLCNDDDGMDLVGECNTWDGPDMDKGQEEDKDEEDDEDGTVHTWFNFGVWL